MVKCPFCQYENEDGALFCEQCKSDLGAVQSSAPGAAPAHQEPPVAAVVEGTPAEAQPVLMEATPVADATIPVAAPVAETVTTTPPEEPAKSTSEHEALASASVAPEAPASAPTAEPAPAAEGGALPAGAQPRLVVMRGLKIGVEYPLYDGLNFVGRADEKPVDIDLEDQEPPDRIWSSRQHALISYEGGSLSIEDLNSSNGTFVNRQRIYPGQKRPLNVNDVIQIGTVQMKVKA
ncbi:MAG TPA: FHA domain-containing protein [Gemmataceae bacterium]|nr:FHA domain-containing protein [Gemmataceae bacterium]